MRQFALLAVLSALAPGTARAAAASNGAVTLRRPISSRAAAFGEAFSAVGGGLDSLGINPAGVEAAKRPELLSTFTSGVADDAFGFVGYAHPLKAGVAAAGAAYYDAGSVNIVSSDGSQQSVTAERDYVGMAAWAMPLGGGVSAGALGKVYNFTLAQSVHASGFAGDAGLRWATPLSGVSLGAALQNLGPGVKFEVESDPLPMTARIGAAWTIESRPAEKELSYFSSTRLTFTVDGIQVRNESAEVATGGEFALDIGPATSIALRLSYGFDQVGDGLSFGIGLRESRFVLDYAFISKRDLGSVQDISLGIRF